MILLYVTRRCRTMFELFNIFINTLGCNSVHFLLNYMFMKYDWQPCLPSC